VGCYWARGRSTYNNINIEPATIESRVHEPNDYTTGTPSYVGTLAVMGAKRKG